MMKAATITLSLALVLTAVTTAPVQAQISGGENTETAVQEAVRRQAQTIELRQKLAEAQASVQRKDMAAAGKQYQAAYELTRVIGTGVDAEKKAAVAGVVWITTERAKAAQQKGDYREADVQLKSALRADPANQSVLLIKKENDARLAAQAGRYPSTETLEKIPGIVTNKVHINTLIQDGKLLFELGKWDDAEAKLKQVLEEDGSNSTALYYLRLVQEARFAIANRSREFESAKRIVEIEDAWQSPVQRDTLPTPNPFARTNLIYTSPGRQAIASKLNRISLSDVKYDGLELSEVIRNLADETRKRDPDKLGINFLILADTGTAAAAPTVDPATGLPVVAAAEAVDVGTIRVKINPPLNNLRLVDVLDAIVRTAEKPIKYSIEDYAVVFSLKPAEPLALYTRTFKVDPNTFYQGLESVGSISLGNFSSGSGGSGGGNSGGGNSGGSGNGQDSGGSAIPRVFAAGGGGGGGNGGGGGGGNGGGSSGSGISFVTKTNSMEGVSGAVRGFFQAAGVDLAAPKALFFNDRKGLLFVRATLQDLDIIEAAIQTLNVTPPQVNIKARIAEVSQNDSRALGFDWMLGNTLVGNQKSIGLQGGTAPIYNGQPTFANPLGSFPDATVANNSAPSLITSGLRQSGVPVATVSGILTDPQFRVVINALEQRDGVDVLSAPEVTTLSGRQAQIQVVDNRTIVTGLDANQTSSSSGTTTTGQNTGGGGVGSTIQPQTASLPFGPTLDVIPYVSADEYSVQMTIIPTVTEFVGYDTSTFTVQAQSVGSGSGGALIQQVPLPHIRTRQVTTSCVVWDGQTVVLGGLISEDIQKVKDKVPVLGDLPLLGRAFRSESSTTTKKNLLIFVTPTIIDPAGNRLHSDEEMPFAQGSIPAQRPVGAAPKS